MKILKYTNETVETIKKLRKPLFKTISLSKINKNTEIYQHYSRGSLTRDILLNSSENPFLIAFFYNELFDINEYLEYLMDMEMTNLSYNVIKTYSKNSSIIQKINGNSIINRILKGELLRICEIDIKNNIGSDPFVFLGYCSIGNTLLPNFEDAFNLIVSKNEITVGVIAKILYDFEYSFKSEIILNNFDVSLIDENVVSKIINEIDFNRIKQDQIVKICKNKDSQSLALSKIFEIKEESIFYNVVLEISSDFDIYMKIKNGIYNKIKSTNASPLINDFLLVSFYNEPNSFDYTIFESVCKVNGLCDSEEYKLIMKLPGVEISNNIDFLKPNASDSIIEVSRLFAKFIYVCHFNPPSLESVLDFPEKFFSNSLKHIKDESAKYLKIFNDNLLNERLKRVTYEKIEKDVFIKYLIKRHKIFEIDMTGYEYLMDDKYKIMYGIYNVEWACKNIEELKRIGITEKLYNSIKGKGHGTLLEDVVPIDRVVCSDIDQIPSKKMKIQLNYNSNICNFKEVDELNSELDNESNSKSDNQSDNQSDSLFIEMPPSIDSLHANTILQNIFNSLKNNITDFSVSEIKDSAEYEYIIKSLFEWCKSNKLFSNFVDFFKKSVVSFNLNYEQIKEMVHASFSKFKDSEIFKSVAFSLIFSDISLLIDDSNNSNIDSIIHGLLDRFKKHDINQSEQDEIEKLVHSDSINHVVVGANLFGLIENPKFNIDHLLTFKRDDIVLIAVKQLKTSQNDLLIKILFTRGLIDELSAEICKKLDLSTLNEKDMSRIYSLFYLNPLNFIKYEMYQCGFHLDEHITIDLIECLPRIFSETLFSKVSSILSSFEMTQSCFDQMISSLENSNYLFKVWVFDNLSTVNITLPYFIKLCWFICNEDDLEIVKKGLLVLKKGRSFDIIDKWAKMKKFERLTRRVYPLRMTDKEFYESIFSKIEDTEERRILNEVYDIVL